MIAESLVAAQCALWGLQALHEVSKANPKLEANHPYMVQLIWRSIFDRLYIKVGSVIETSHGAANLTNLQLAAISLCESEPAVCESIRSVTIITPKSKSLQKWRNKTVAHNDPKFNVDAFYTEHKMHVSEYQPIIDHLFEALNQIAFASVNKIYVKPEWSSEYAREAARLFGSHSTGLREELDV